MPAKAEQSADTRLQIVYRPLKGLVPYARNARTHPPKQILKLKASLAEYGWANPMLIADGQMIAGHGRLQAALEMAEAGAAIPRNPDPWAGPTIDLSHLSESQRKAYVLADNKLALDSGWDEDMLAMELGELQESGFNLSLAGFDPGDLKKLLGDNDPDLDGDSVLGEGLQYQVVVDCRDEGDQAEVLERLKAEGRTCKPLTL